mmetsp:Transcript_33998/g.79191  ORF Transcript_33998/g.79191 Transcript_33998/m.79191 type:complete len:414 (+) Transcript_33998:81-1322(+)
MHEEPDCNQLRQQLRGMMGREPGTCCFKRFASRGLLASSVWVPRQWLALLLDQCASAAVVFHLMVCPDTVIVNLTAVASVLFYREVFPDLHMNLTWTVVGFALVFPLQTAIREAFKRREQALMAISDFRATLLNVYLANQIWDWPGADAWYGRAEDNVPREQGGHGKKKGSFKDTPLPPQHGQRVFGLLVRLVEAMQELLLVPRRGRSRQEFCTCVSPEKEMVEDAELQGRSAVLKLLGRLHRATEELKAAGMPANEASRINQYNMFLCRDFERLWSLKTYRTPTTLRSVCRVSIQVFPFFFGPYYLHLIKTYSADSDVTDSVLRHRFIFACLFSCLTSTTLVALLNVAVALENPFRPGSTDTIRVQEEFQLCREALQEAMQDQEEAWYERFEFEWEVLRSPGDDGSTSDGDA